MSENTNAIAIFFVEAKGDILDKDTVLAELREIQHKNDLLKLADLNKAEFIPIVEDGKTKSAFLVALISNVNGDGDYPGGGYTIKPEKADNDFDTLSARFELSALAPPTGMGVTIPTGGGDMEPNPGTKEEYDQTYHLTLEQEVENVGPSKELVIYVLDTAWYQIAGMDRFNWVSDYVDKGWINQVQRVEGDRTEFEKTPDNDQISDVNTHGQAVIDVLRRVMLDNPSQPNPSKVKIVLVEVMNRYGFGTVNSFMQQVKATQKDINPNVINLINMSFVFDLTRAGEDKDQWPPLSRVMEPLVRDGIWVDVEREAFKAAMDIVVPRDAPNLDVILGVLHSMGALDNTRLFGAAGSSDGDKTIPYLPAALVGISGVTANLDKAHNPEFPNHPKHGYRTIGEVVAPNGKGYGNWKGTSFAVPIIVGAFAKMILAGYTLEGAEDKLPDGSDLNIIPMPRQTPIV